MKIENIVVPTGVARPGMTVGEAFRICLAASVPGIPCMDEGGHIQGRMSIRHTLKHTCIPEYMVLLADLIGDEAKRIAIPEEHAKTVLKYPIDPFILKDVAIVTPRASIAKALAIMEKYNTNYIFVVEGETYQGTVTILGIAKRMLELET